MTNTSQFTISNPKQSRSLNMPWKNCTCVGRAYDLIREDTLEHLRYLQREIGFSYCRFHALFHDDMQVVKRREDGTLDFQWHHVDKIYDALLAMGIRPFVELNPMPNALASGDQTMFVYKMNVTPPEDFSEWEQLHVAFAKHLIRRYGLEEVRQWYFEVWNEPNLDCFWSGTQEQYFELYAASARGLKSVDSGLRVGGPSTAQAGWVPEMIDYCVTNNVPIDFVSTHIYPMDEPIIHGDCKSSPHDFGEFMSDHVKSVQQQVKASALPDLEIHWTEWNAQTAATKADVTFMDNIHMDSLYGAAMVAKQCLQLDDTCDSLAYWAASDIFEEHPISNSPFSCSYGLVTNVGIPKASCNAMRLMSQLRGDIMDISTEEAPHGCGLMATREGDVIHVLLYNHAFINERTDSWQADVTLNDLDSGTYQLVQAHIKAGKGSAREAWEQLGRPQNLTPFEERMLRDCAEPEASVGTIDVATNSTTLSFDLAPQEVIYVELRPAELPALPKSQVPQIPDRPALAKQAGTTDVSQTLEEQLGDNTN